MIPKDSELAKKAKYFLLEEYDIILKEDQYYNNSKDKWLPVQKEFIGNDYRFDESKPVRRLNTDIKNEKEI